MLYREIFAVCSEIHTKRINTPYGQKVECVDVKAGGTYSNHWTLKGVYGIDSRLRCPAISIHLFLGILQFVPVNSGAVP